MSRFVSELLNSTPVRSSPCFLESVHLVEPFGVKLKPKHTRKKNIEECMLYREALGFSLCADDTYVIVSPKYKLFTDNR